MSRALELAIEAQAAAGLVGRRVSDTAAADRRRRAVAMSRPLGLRLLAWCDAHRELVVDHTDLVEALRAALETGERIAGIVSEIYSEVPEAMESAS